MSAFLFGHETALRLGAFFAVLAVMLAWEAAARRRPAGPEPGPGPASGPGRRATNFGLIAIDTMLLRLLLPAAAVVVAVLAELRQWGLFNLLPAPDWLAIAASVVLLDLAIWLQHRVMHAVPPLWRLHRVHHSDLVFDTTTALRFHPVEILLSMLYKMAVVLALGAPAEAVVLFEVLLSAAALFNHGNVRMPLALDRWLRYVIVTPDMHRVHHSVHREETDSNFGFMLSLWDRLFGTYRAQPRDGHAQMTIGLQQFRAPAEQRLDRLLLQPLQPLQPLPAAAPPEPTPQNPAERIGRS